MQLEVEKNKRQIWKGTWSVWSLFVLSMLLLGLVYFDGLFYMVQTWNNKEEYGHGFLIPLISLFFIWQNKNKLEEIPFEGAWAGVLILVLGAGLFFLGELSTLYIIVQYAFLVALFGLVLAWLGWRAIRIIWAPLLLLVFMIPLPNFLYNGLSAQLQLISSELGVWVIRMFGISVYLEGNVIDLGAFKLQVVEACSGLRYLFPLMTLGVMIAYLYQGTFWKKAVIVLSTIPITVLMNSFRIGVIGILVEYWGQTMAEGFLHDFEGWFVFMACMGILLVEMMMLSRVGGDRRPLRDVFGLDFPGPSPKNAIVNRRKVPGSLLSGFLVLVVAAVLAQSLGQREEIVPQRAEFSGFPMQVGDWKGRSNRLEQIYLDALKLDDYILTDYIGPGGEQINFYVAYYASQSKGESAHSPRTCLPGGGWQIEELNRKLLDVDQEGGAPLQVNRVVIKKGEYTQLVYYWFQGRGRNITNEYMAKWFLFWDALTRNRTDGALVRLTTFIRPGEDLEQGDKLLTSYAISIVPILPKYIPDKSAN